MLASKRKTYQPEVDTPDDRQHKNNKHHHREETRITSQDFKCPVCLNLLCLPVSTSCGHNVCRNCAARLVLEFSNDQNSVLCPVCRAHFHVPSFRRFAVNSLFSELLHSTFPDENMEREPEVTRDFSRALAELRGYGAEEGLGGERNGQHQGGFEETVPSVQFELRSNVRAIRNHVRDANDYLMHLALAVVVDPNPCDLFMSSRSKLTFVMLEMEEDEAKESGFPTAIDMSEREHTCLICTWFDGWITLSIYGLKGSKVNKSKARRREDVVEDDQELLAQHRLEARNGVVTFHFGMGSPDWYLEYFDIRVQARADESTVCYEYSIRTADLPLKRSRILTRCVGGELDDEEDLRGDDDGEDVEEDDDDEGESLDGFIVPDEEDEAPLNSSQDDDDDDSPNENDDLQKIMHYPQKRNHYHQDGDDDDDNDNDDDDDDDDDDDSPNEDDDLQKILHHYPPKRKHAPLKEVKYHVSEDGSSVSDLPQVQKKRVRYIRGSSSSSPASLDRQSNNRDSSESELDL